MRNFVLYMLNHICKYIYIYICNVYMGSRRAIYNDIAPKPRFFFVRGKKFPRARPCPREFFWRGGQKTEVEAAISLYIARRDPIYIINVPFFFSLFYKGFINKLLILCSTHQIPQLMMLSLTVSSRGFRHASELGLYLYYFSNITDKRSGNLL